MKRTVCKLEVHEVHQRKRSANVDVGEDIDGQYFSEEIEAWAVADDGGTNKKWAHWTPSAKFNITIDNPSAQGDYQPGDTMYVTMSKDAPEGVED